MIDEQDALKILESLGVILTEGHFRYTSGKHGFHYVRKKLLFEHAWETKRICRAIAAHFRNDAVDVVIGPQTGGAMIAIGVAEHLRGLSWRNILTVSAAKKSDGIFAVEKGFEPMLAGAKVLIVDDVLTTGDTIRKTIQAVELTSGTVVGVGVIFNRGCDVQEKFRDIRNFFAVVTKEFPSWDPPCPKCIAGIPLNPTPDKE